MGVFLLTNVLKAFDSVRVFCQVFLCISLPSRAVQLR